MKMFLRSLLALLALAAIAGGAILGINPSVSIQSGDRDPISVSTQSLPLSIFCPGALTELGGADGTEISSLALVGEASLWTHSEAAAVTQDFPSQITEGASLSLLSNEQTTSALSALQAQVAKRERMKGLAAINCSQPVSSGYFATGMASVGRESILKLANPGINEVQIFLSFALSGGSSELTLTLAPGEAKDLSLAPYVDAESNFGVSFETNGPAVSVAMQLRTSSGLATSGVDLVAASPAGAHLWIPGLEIFEGAFSAPRLRLFNPQAQDVKALVTLHGVDTESDVFEVQVPSGAVIEQVLDLAVGEYVVEVAAEIDLVAAIWSQRLSENLDFAWLIPAQAFAEAASIPVPQLPAELVIANPANEPISVSLQNSGQYSSLTIPASRSVRVPVSYPLAQVQSSSPFMVNLQILADSGYAVVAVVENLNLGADLEILVR